MTLPTEHGPVSFVVAAVYFDYSSDRGVVIAEDRVLGLGADQ